MYVVGSFDEGVGGQISVHARYPPCASVAMMWQWLIMHVLAILPNQLRKTANRKELPKADVEG